MRFYTSQECEEWLRERARSKPGASPENQVERFGYPKEHYRIFSLAHWIATSTTFRQPTLLWITEWGIWPSSENWHLYYKLRHAYGDQQLLQESPGHLFLEHEVEDLASFMQIAMLSGWSGYILTEADYVNAFFSHDEYIDFFANVDENLADVREFGTRMAIRLPAPQ